MGSINNEDFYLLQRGDFESKRLNLQHFIWRSSLNFLLHPSIPLTSPSLRIADLATGSGFWLTDLARTLPPTAYLHGYDISTSQFPAQCLLPANITLQQQDLLSPFPTSVLGSYDVLHLRALSFAFGKNDWERCLQNAIKLLKPNGYIQWDEPQLSLTLPFGISSPKSPTFHMAIVRALLFSISQKMDRQISHGPTLTHLFSTYLQATSSTIHRNDANASPLLLQNINENALAAVKGVFYRALEIGGGTIEGLGGEDEAESLLAGIMVEMAGEKAWWTQEMYVVVGRNVVCATPEA
ncbi:hypothetical protein BJ878DRAFT_32503 [Calycina marina]|uniref:Methyltransferase domain-containing protein n=1 Tax=Calycina marina TaxID=1763456 RepID=A0A9P7Z5C4_9HELO|nr:hypothetical protein BJ878DRAFT_32503 [Calycina marina]